MFKTAGTALCEFTFSPGYCDMLGAYHCQTLKKTPEGGWVIECRDREEHSSPEVVATYPADAEKVASFAGLLGGKAVRSLAKRGKSRDFITDYSPWSMRITFEPADGKRSEKDYLSLDQYRRYSKKDYQTIEEIKAAFAALKED